MPEGVFPKTDGQILYASEVNRVSPKLIGFVSQDLDVTADTTGSLATYGGSVIYPGTGSIEISEFMIINHHVSTAEYSTGSSITAALLISGPGLTNMRLGVLKSTAATLENKAMNFNHILRATDITASGGNLGSQYVIFGASSATAPNLLRTHNDLTVLGF